MVPLLWARFGRHPLVSGGYILHFEGRSKHEFWGRRGAQKRREKRRLQGDTMDCMDRPPMRARAVPGPLTIPDSELQFAAARSSGPGGQNVNKVETKVTVTFDYLKSAALSWEEKGRIGKHPAVQSCLDADGAIAISSQRFRSQARNREDAIEKLHELLRAAVRLPKRRIATKKTRGSERRRMDHKRLRGEAKAGRQKIRPGADGGD